LKTLHKFFWEAALPKNLDHFIFKELGQLLLRGKPRIDLVQPFERADPFHNLVGGFSVQVQSPSTKSNPIELRQNQLVVQSVKHHIVNAFDFGRL
jgi:hypothetical protein